MSTTCWLLLARSNAREKDDDGEPMFGWANVQIPSMRKSAGSRPLDQVSAELAGRMVDELDLNGHFGGLSSSRRAEGATMFGIVA
jgi:hypothetical protein